MLTLAVPKGRILDHITPHFAALGIEPEADFYDPASRKLAFACRGLHDEADGGLRIIRIRNSDAPTFVAQGAADLAICGDDHIRELHLQEVYAPVDLGIATCRLVLAAPRAADLTQAGIRIATSFPNLARKYCLAQGIDASFLDLRGAVELAPQNGLADAIVDLTESGTTLRQHQLEIRAEILQVSAHLIINRTRFKTQRALLDRWIGRFQSVFEGG